MPFAVADIAADLGGQVLGSADLIIHGIAPLEVARPNEISFLSHPKYRAQLLASGAGCVVIAPRDMQSLAAAALACRTWICTPDPYLYFALLTQWWRKKNRLEDASGIHPTAVVDPSACVHPQASIGALSVIGAMAKIGAGTRIGARVSVGQGCVIGQRCILHSGVVIGADGFGFAPRQDKSWEKIEQLGGVRIGDDVEIGANSCVDRGALTDTVIEDGVKIDNLVQIGHNVRIGRHSALAGNAGVAGSASIGAYCTVGGGAVILGHLQIADHVHISASTTVMRSIPDAGTYTGVFPIDGNRQWEKNAATLRQLHSLRERLRQLEITINPSGNLS